jgi:hypothetical protein
MPYRESCPPSGASKRRHLWSKKPFVPMKTGSALRTRLAAVPLQGFRSITCLPCRPVRCVRS